MGYETIAGWLYVVTRHLACKAIRRENRRRAREREFAAMPDIAASPEIVWEKLRPLIDSVIARLDCRERDAILLRFFEGKSYREVGLVIGLNEEAARKRVDRALEKLRIYFARNGITISIGALAETISTNAMETAPVAFATEVASASLADAGAASNAFLAWFDSFVFMSTTTKILLVATVIIVAVVSIHYLTQLPATPVAKVVAAAGQIQPPVPAQVVIPKQAPAPVSQEIAPATQTSPVGNADTVPVVESPPPLPTDKAMQEALVLMVPLSQTYNDFVTALTKANDPDMALQKVNLMETQFEEILAKVKGTPLEQQVAPEIKTLKALQDALLHGDLASARKIIQALNAMGPKLQGQIEQTAGMTIDQAARSASQTKTPGQN